MRQARSSRLWKATLRAVLAFVGLAVFVWVASAPGWSETARIGLTIAGYLWFVLFSRTALLAFRLDGKDAGRPPGPPAKEESLDRVSSRDDRLLSAG